MTSHVESSIITSPNPIPHPINDSTGLSQQELEKSLFPIKRFLMGPSIPNPKAYRKGLKKCITVLVSACAAVDSISTNIFYRAFFLAMAVLQLTYISSLSP